MRSIFFSLLLALPLIGALSTTPAFAADAAKASQTTQNFIKKRYSIKGGWNVTVEDGKTIIHFDDSFKTKSGPDLKVVLHKAALDDVDPKTAIDKGLKIGVLKSNRGAQSYILPDDILLSDYKSVLIHCEAFSVLWGGFDIAETSNAP